MKGGSYDGGSSGGGGGFPSCCGGWRVVAEKVMLRRIFLAGYRWLLCTDQGYQKCLKSVYGPPKLNTVELWTGCVPFGGARRRKA